MLLEKEIQTVDTISRQAAIGVLEERIFANGYSNTALISELNRSIGYLTRLPSAQTEQKVGKWLKISPAGIYECSECGQAVMTSDIDCYKFCHGCGARMEGTK